MSRMSRDKSEFGLSHVSKGGAHMADQIDHPLFSRFYVRNEAAMERVVGGLRASQNARANGRTLIIGAGTGLDVEPLGPRVTDVVLLEPDRSMRGELAGRWPEIPVLASPAEHMDVPDASFDTVLSSLVLCSVRDVDAVLREIARVLRPDGQFLFLEHVRHDRLLPRVTQDALTPLWKVMGAGCHLNRSLQGALRRSPLRVADVRQVRDGWLFPIIAGRALP